MAKGEKFTSEKKKLDHENTAAVWKLTDHNGWHILPYFTSPAFTPDSKNFAFHSDRGGKMDIYSIDIGSGEITQLTDIAPDIPAPALRSLGIATNYPIVRCELASLVDRRVYFLAGNEFHSVHVDTLQDELLWRIPDDIIIGRAHMNTQGTHILFPAIDVGIFDIADELRHLRQHYTWKRVNENPHLTSRLMVLDIDTKKVEEWHRENAWISHAQFSPLNRDRVLYCHEGVWEDVDDRIWIFDRSDGVKKNLRQQTHDVCIGHEIWIPGSERILYHGWIGDNTLIGFINADGSEMTEYLNRPRHYGHFCPNRDGTLIVTDAGTYPDTISLITFEDSEAVFTPLFRHLNIWRHPWDHPHPQFSPDGRYIAFTASDSPGCSSIYLAEVPREFRRGNQA